MKRFGAFGWCWFFVVCIFGKVLEDAACLPCTPLSDKCLNMGGCLAVRGRSHIAWLERLAMVKCQVFPHSVETHEPELQPGRPPAKPVELLERETKKQTFSEVEFIML